MRNTPANRPLLGANSYVRYGNELSELQHSGGDLQLLLLYVHSDIRNVKRRRRPLAYCVPTRKHRSPGLLQSALTRRVKSFSPNVTLRE